MMNQNQPNVASHPGRRADDKVSMERVQSGTVENREDTRTRLSSNRRRTARNIATATQMTFGMLLAAFALQSVGPQPVESGSQNKALLDQDLIVDPSQEKDHEQTLRKGMPDKQKQAGDLIPVSGGADPSALISEEPKTLATYNKLSAIASLDATLEQFDSKHDDSKLTEATRHVNDSGEKDSLLGPNLTDGLNQMGPISMEQLGSSPIQNNAQATDGISLSPNQQIAEHVRVTLERGDREATLRLEPAELGKVRIHLRLDNGQVHLSIQAEQQDTNRLLQQKISDLRANLDAQGVKVGDLSVIDQHQGKYTNDVMRDQMLHQVKTTLNNASGDMNRSFAGHAAPDFGGHSFGQQGHREQTSGRQLGAMELGPVSVRPPYASQAVSPSMWVNSQGWLEGIDAYV
jgi:flagellar hook-length control protein FliK